MEYQLMHGEIPVVSFALDDATSAILRVGRRIAPSICLSASPPTKIGWIAQRSMPGGMGAPSRQPSGNPARIG